MENMAVSFLFFLDATKKIALLTTVNLSWMMLGASERLGVNELDLGKLGGEIGCYKTSVLRDGKDGTRSLIVTSFIVPRIYCEAVIPSEERVRKTLYLNEHEKYFR